MSAVYFQYGTWAPAICPKVQIRNEPIMATASLGGGMLIPAHYEETWTVEGQFVGDQDSLIGQYVAARTALETHNQALILGRTEGNIRQVLPANTVDGIVVSHALPNLDGAELASVLTWSATFRMKVGIEGGEWPVDLWTYTIDTENADGVTTFRVRGFVENTASELSDSYDRLKAELATLFGVTYRLMAEVTSTASNANRIEFQLEYQSLTPLVFGWRQSIQASPPMYRAIPMEIVPGVGTTQEQDAPVIQIGARTPAILVDSGTCVFDQLGLTLASPKSRVKHQPIRGTNGAIIGFPIEWRYEYISQSMPTIIGIPTGSPLDPYLNHPTMILERELAP